MKAVESCKTERRGTGPLTLTKPSGRAVCEPVPLFYYKNLYQATVGIRALFASLVWKYLQAPAVCQSFSGTLLPWWMVLLCWELGKGSWDEARTPHCRGRTSSPGCSLSFQHVDYLTQVKGEGHAHCQMEGKQHLAVTVITAPVTPAREWSSPFAIHPLGTCFLWGPASRAALLTSALLRTTHTSSHGSCSPLWTSLIELPSVYLPWIEHPSVCNGSNNILWFQNLLVQLLLQNLHNLPPALYTLSTHNRQETSLMFKSHFLCCKICTLLSCSYGRGGRGQQA